jgi:acyl-CoA reductase-like NAD-dependent aldehyde dehydrogenase
MDHASTARLIGDARIGYVAFTGSVPGGHAVQRAAAERFVGTGLELGGKDPAYVRADAPLAATVENLVDGSYFNSGQSCCAVERIYVHRAIYPAVRRRLRRISPRRTGSAIRSSRGPPRSAGAHRRRGRVRAQIADAVSKGREGCLNLRDQEGTPYLPPRCWWTCTTAWR